MTDPRILVWVHSGATALLGTQLGADTPHPGPRSRMGPSETDPKETGLEQRTPEGAGLGVQTHGSAALRRGLQGRGTAPS